MKTTIIGCSPKPEGFEPSEFREIFRFGLISTANISPLLNLYDRFLPRYLSRGPSTRVPQLQALRVQSISPGERVSASSTLQHRTRMRQLFTETHDRALASTFKRLLHSGSAIVRARLRAPICWRIPMLLNVITILLQHWHHKPQCC